MKSKTLFSLVVLTLFTSLIPAMQAQTFSVIHTFTDRLYGGPSTGVTIRGNTLYGTVGASVYQLNHSGSNWVFSTLAVSSSYSDLLARVVFGPDGHLYGTANSGGPYSYGGVFKPTPQVGPCKDAACYWTVSDVHDFGSGTDGAGPGHGDLTWDQQGNMYDTTQWGGTSGAGTVYELTPSGNGYTESVLYNFSGPDGANPYTSVVFDNKGNLFGTTYQGGSGNCGNVFELTYVSGVGWTEHVLYNFQGADDGAFPIGGLIFDSAGNLYGTTAHGGSGYGGTVFELSPSGNTWKFKLLYSFSGSQWEGGPEAALTMDGAGNLYGTTSLDGADGGGNVFKLSNTENGWVYTSLYDFTGGTDGGFAIGNVSIDTDGTLYGATLGGGDPNCQCGVVWMIKP